MFGVFVVCCLFSGCCCLGFVVVLLLFGFCLVVVAWGLLLLLWLGVCCCFSGLGFVVVFLPLRGTCGGTVLRSAVGPGPQSHLQFL